MCGRYYIDYEVDLVLEEIYESLFQQGEMERVPFREVFPDTAAATLVPEEGFGVKPVLKRWGEKRGSMPLVINARQETVLERPMFCRSFEANRCVIPASGFYEWAKTGRVKQKYRISAESGPVYMAGLYLPHPDVDRYVIITTASAGDMQIIHSRSPLILGKDEYPEYLHSLSYAKERLQQMNAPLLIRPEKGTDPVQLSFLDLP